MRFIPLCFFHIHLNTLLNRPSPAHRHSQMLSSLAALSYAPPQPNAAAWAVIQKQFSAVSIGLAFTDDKTGYTSFTDGASAPVITKTVDGGATWSKTAVNTTGAMLMPMGFASGTGAGAPIVSVGMAANKHSSDGVNFLPSKGGPFSSQGVAYSPSGDFAVAGDNGVCVSSDKGATFKCMQVPGMSDGRYVAMPSKDVIYLTAGHWPANPPSSPSAVKDSDVHRISHGLRLREGKVEMGAEAGVAANGDYAGSIWKSADAGATWTQLLSNTGAYYFNGIDCFDETSCVAVAEGFAQDGSTDPGAKVFVTNDGKNFTLAHSESTTGQESLMAAKMLSKSEHWAGGTTQSGGFSAPLLALHSTDGGKTWANEDNGVKGQMITAMSFPSAAHGYATTVNALQVCSLLEYK